MLAVTPAHTFDIQHTGRGQEGFGFNVQARRRVMTRRKGWGGDRGGRGGEEVEEDEDVCYGLKGIRKTKKKINVT